MDLITIRIPVATFHTFRYLYVLLGLSLTMQPQSVERRAKVETETVSNWVTSV